MASCVTSGILQCRADRDKHLYDFMHQQLFKHSDMNSELSTMHSTSRRYQNPAVDTKDTFAVKGIIALLMCVAYAGVLFCLAAVVTTVFSTVRKSAHSVCLNIWESESTKKMEVSKPIRKPIRHGQK